MPAWALEETPAVHTCKMSSRSRNHSQLSSLYELMLESSKLPTVIFCACQCTTYFSKLLSKCNRHLAIHSRKNCWDAVKDNHEVQPFCHSPLQWKKNTFASLKEGSIRGVWMQTAPYWPEQTALKLSWKLLSSIQYAAKFSMWTIFMDSLSLALCAKQF